MCLSSVANESGRTHMNLGESTQHQRYKSPGNTDTNDTVLATNIGRKVMVPVMYVCLSVLDFSLRTIKLGFGHCLVINNTHHEPCVKWSRSQVHGHGIEMTLSFDSSDNF